MRKIYYLFLTMLLGMVGMTANAQNITVTINVDDASHVKAYTYYYDNSYNKVEKELSFEGSVCTANVPTCQEIKIKTVSGFLFKTVKENNIEDSRSVNATEKSFYCSSNTKIDIETVSEDAVYPSSFKLTVDNPSSIRALLSTSYRDLTLNEGENTIKYNPETETQLMISPVGSAPLYKVTNNGKDVTPQGTTYYVSNLTTANVEVKSVWPDDVKFKLTFNFEDEVSKGFISSVSVNGTPIENYTAADGIDVQGGAQVSITGNITEYALDAFTVDGTNANFGYGQYNFYITANTTLGFKAHKYATNKVTVNVDDPANVSVYRGYTSSNDRIEVTAGDNVIEISENATQVVTIVANEQCYLVSVNNGTEDLSISSGQCAVSVTDGMTITVKSGKIVRDKTATVNVYGREKADQYFSFYSNSDRSLTYPFVEGENELKFCDSDLSFNFGCYGSTIGQTNKIYLNGYLAQTYYGQYQLNFDDGATIDIVLDPAKFEKTEKKVSFTLGENITYSSATVTFPGGEAYNWSTEGLVTVNDANYEVTLTPAYGVAIAVSVDGNAVTANTEGAFVFTVKPTSNVTVYDPATGLNSINAENADNSFYTLQGVKVNGKAKGLYIKNGKKVVVK